MIRLGIVLVAQLFICGCASIDSVAYLEIDRSTSSLYQPIGDTVPVLPVETIKSVKVEEVNLDAKSQPNNVLLLVTTLNGKHVNFGDYVAVAVPFKLVGEQPVSEIVLKSHYVKPAAGEGFVLFPLITALDASGNVIKNLEPKEGSRVRGNTVYNYFSLPPQTEYILAHSRPDLVSAEFLESVGEESIDGVNVATGIASALGGVFGGLFVGIWSNSQVERGEVALSPIGIIEISRTE